MMAEYIEREAALLGIEEWAKTSCEFDYMWPLVFNSIRKIPVADVRPVVLCRDCKHNKRAIVWRFLDLDDVTADCSAGHGYPPMDWFCADGEKREES